MYTKVAKKYKAHKVLILLLILIFLSIPVRMWGLAQFPPIVVDEPAYLRDIQIILSGNFYFAHPQWDGSQSFLVYCPTVILILLGIPNLLSLRIESVLLSILGLIPFFYIVKKYTNLYIGFCSSLLLSYSYYYLQFSRVGWGVIFATVFGLYCVWMAILAIENRSIKFTIASSVFAAITFYSYRSGELYIAASFIIFTLLLFRRGYKEKIKMFLIFTVLFLSLSSFWIFFIAFHPYNYFLRANVVSLINAQLPYMDNASQLQAFLYQIKTVFWSWILMFPVQGNMGHVENPRYLPLSFPPISPLLIPFYWLGLFTLFKEWKKYYIWIFIFIVGLITSQILNVYPPNGARAFVILPVIYLCISLGLFYTYNKLMRFKHINILLITFSFTVALFDFLFYLFWMSWIKV